MGWNYRLIYHPPVQKSLAYYGIHETYYNKKDKADSYAIEPEVVSVEIFDINNMVEHHNAIVSIRKKLNDMRACLDKDLLYENQIGSK